MLLAEHDDGGERSRDEGESEPKGVAGDGDCSRKRVLRTTLSVTGDASGVDVVGYHNDRLAAHP